MTTETLLRPLVVLAAVLAVSACGPREAHRSDGPRVGTHAQALGFETSDLSVTLTDGVTTVTPGDSVTYTITVTNFGPDVTQQAHLTLSPPPELSGSSWSCTGTGGADCGVPGGIGAIDLTTGSLPAGGALVVTLNGLMGSAADGALLSLTADVSTQSGTDPNLSNNSATDTDTVFAPSADVSVTETASPDPVLSSGQLTYSANLANAGPASATSVTFTQVFDPNETFVSLNQTSGPAGNCTTPPVGASGTITCTFAALASGASAGFEMITAVVASQGTLSAIANIAASETDPDSTNNTVTVVTTVGPPGADLSITLSGPSTATAGSAVTYLATVANNGPGEVSGVTLVEALPAGTSLAGFSGTDWSCASNAGQITCTLAGVLAVAVAPALSLQLALSPGATGSVSQTVSVSPTTDDPFLDNNTSSSVTSVVSSADLSLQVASPGSVPVGAATGLTATVTNAGPSDAQDVTLTQTLPTGFTNVSAAGSGWTCSVGSSGGATVVTCTLPTLAPGTAPVVTVQATAPSGPGQLDITTTVGSSTADPDGANNAASNALTVASSADVSISETASPDPVLASGQLTYSATLGNAGPSDATNVTFTQVLDPEETFVSLNQTFGPAGACTTPAVGASGTVTCTFATLPSGASAGFDLTTTAPAAQGALSATASIAASEPDPASANNAVTVATTVAPPPVAQADLSLALTAPTDPVYAGTPVSLSLTVRNAGPDDAETVTVVESFPGARDVSASGTGWTCATDASETVTCTADTLPVGESQTLSVLATLDTTLTTSASVTAASEDPDDSNDGASATVTVVGEPDVRLTATGPLEAEVGGPLEYALEVENQGGSSATGLTLSQVLPPGAGFEAAQGTGWTCTSATAGSPATVTVTCAYGSALDADAKTSLTIEATAPTTAGDAVSTVSVSTSTPNLAPSGMTEATVHTQVAEAEPLTPAPQYSAGGGCNSPGSGGPLGLALLGLLLLLRKSTRPAAR